MHTAVFQPEADQPFFLISGFNGIMLVGGASFSLWQRRRCAAALGNLFKEKPTGRSLAVALFSSFTC